MRVLIVEDSGFMADALMRLLSAHPGFTVVGQVVNRAEAISRAITLQPDLVILDLQIKDSPYGESSPEHGLATLHDLDRLTPRPEVLIFTHMPEQPWLRIVAQAGASGFVSKDSESDTIMMALQAIKSPMTAFTRVQRRLIDQPPISLSKREHDVLRLLAEGLGNQDIAARLNISVGTVRKHVENLCAAFGVNSRGQVVAAAHREGLIKRL